MPHAPSLRRLIAPAVATAVLVLGEFVPQPALRDALTHEPVSDRVARLHYPDAYIVLSPFYDLLDALALLTVAQHIAVLVTLIALYVAWRTRRWAAPAASWTRRATREFLAALAALALLVGFYAFGVLAPRPMAQLRLFDPALVAVDFHAHTHASHDGRPGFTAERVREWHASSGFDVAYVTDHKAWWGAAEGMRANPERAGEGTIILSGLELRSWGQNVNVIGMTAADSAFVTDQWRLKPGLRLAHNGKVPVVMQTIPYDLGNFAHESIDTLTTTNAMELHDAAPRGMQFALRNRAALLALIDTADLAVLAGSDNHGWGRTAVAWSVLPIPGWRAMTPAQLGEAIEDRIREERKNAGRVFERPGLALDGPALPVTLPALLWQLNATLSPSQRMSWIIWVWVIANIGLVVRARRRRTEGVPG